MSGIMTPNNLIEELRDRFKITILELRKNLPEYEIKMYCDALGITETTLFWAIKNWKPRKEWCIIISSRPLEIKKDLFS